MCRPVKTKPTRRTRYVVRSDDERTAVRWSRSVSCNPNPATHILVFFRAPPRQSQCNRSLIRINWLFLILASSQLKSSTLGRVPPYILVKHTRESNRSPPALRSVIWVLIGPATLSFRPQESKKVGHLSYFCAAFGGSNLYSVGAGEY